MCRVGLGAGRGTSRGTAPATRGIAVGAGDRCEGVEDRWKPRGRWRFFLQSSRHAKGSWRLGLKFQPVDLGRFKPGAEPAKRRWLRNTGVQLPRGCAGTVGGGALLALV